MQVSDAENARCTVKSTTNQLLKDIEDRPLTGKSAHSCVCVLSCCTFAEIAIDQPSFTAASKKKNSWSARVSCVKVEIKNLRQYQPHKVPAIHTLTLLSAETACLADVFSEKIQLCVQEVLVWRN